MTWLVPPSVLTIDIETVAGDVSDAESWMRRAWSPNKSWKPETIGNRYLEALATKKKRLALIDGSPIIAVSFATGSDVGVVHHLDCAETAIGAAWLHRCGDERSMLVAVRELLRMVTADTVLVGHHIRGFDLPRLRGAYAKHRLRMPDCLVSRDIGIYDTMREFRHFTVDDRVFVSLDECLEYFRIPSHKGVVDGSHVGELYAAGKFRELLSYAALDVVVEYRLFQAMTNQVEDAT